MRARKLQMRGYGRRHEINVGASNLRQDDFKGTNISGHERKRA